jgi:hypothetical protein
MDSRRSALQGMERVLLRTVGNTGGRCRQISRQPRKASIYLQHFNLEGQEGLEPSTPCLRAPSDASLGERITEVNAIVDGCRMSWILGCVAVSIAVKMDTAEL